MHALPAIRARRLSWSRGMLLARRWLVLALMGLCLPLQGVLAVTMQMGMAATDDEAMQHMAPSMSSTVPPSVHPAAMSATHMADASGMDHSGHMSHSGHASHDEHAGHVMTVSTQVDHAHHPDPQHGDGQDSHHGCSFCAQCCIGAALPVAPLTVAGASPTQAHPATAPTAVLERQPQALDRPPKAFLA